MRLSLVRSFQFLATCGVFLSVALAPAVEKTVTTADGVFGADSRVRGGTYADTNFGSADRVLLKDLPGQTVPNNYTRKAYIRFDLNRLGVVEALTAALDLEVSDNNGGGSPAGPPENFTVYVHGLDDGDAGEGWRENTITWNNAPANDTGNTTGVLANAEYLGSFPVTSSDVAGTTVTFSNAALAAFISANTDGLVTFILSRRSSNGGANLGFRSKESSQTPPTLRIMTHSDYLDANADAYVRGGTYADDNYGGAADIVVKRNLNLAYARKGYMRFDVSGVDIASVGGAELLMDLAYNNAGGSDTDTAQNHTVSVWGVKDSVDLDDWIETGVGAITWANAPANDTAGNDITSDGTLLVTDFVTNLDSNNHTVAFGAGEATFSNFLKTDTDGLVTLIVVRDSSNGGHNLGFATKEHATLNPPVLRVRIVPVPATWVILIAGAVLLLLMECRRRKRVPVRVRKEGGAS